MMTIYSGLFNNGGDGEGENNSYHPSCSIENNSQYPSHSLIDNNNVNNYKNTGWEDLNKKYEEHKKIMNKFNYYDPKYDIIHPKKDEQNMSLIVILKNKNGIVAASDSKATTTNMGVLEEDKERGEIQKIFKANDLIFSICGQNRIIIGNKLWNIEDFLNHMIETKIYQKQGNPDYVNFFNHLYNSIENKNKLSKFPIEIIYGYKIDNGYIAGEIILSDKINHIQYTGDNCFLRRGYIDLTPKNFYMPNGLNINEMKIFADQYIKTIIKLGDLVLPYNPIGGKIQIESLI